MRTLSRVLAAGILVLVVAACGDDDAATTTSAATTTTAATATTTTAGATTTTAGAGGATVSIISNAFQPSTVEIALGEAVTFTVASGSHTTTSTGNWDSGGLGEGSSYDVTPTAAGTYEFFCSFHASTDGDTDRHRVTRQNNPPGSRLSISSTSAGRSTARAATRRPRSRGCSPASTRGSRSGSGPTPSR